MYSAPPTRATSPPIWAPIKISHGLLPHGRKSVSRRHHIPRKPCTVPTVLSVVSGGHGSTCAPFSHASRRNLSPACHPHFFPTEDLWNRCHRSSVSLSLVFPAVFMRCTAFSPEYYVHEAYVFPLLCLNFLGQHSLFPQLCALPLPRGTMSIEQTRSQLPCRSGSVFAHLFV